MHNESRDSNKKSKLEGVAKLRRKRESVIEIEREREREREEEMRSRNTDWK